MPEVVIKIKDSKEGSVTVDALVFGAIKPPPTGARQLACLVMSNIDQMAASIDLTVVDENSNPEPA